MDGEIVGALVRVSEELGIDSAVLWRWSVGSPDLILPTHVHPPFPAERRFDPLSQDGAPWVCEQMRAGRFVRLARPDEATSEGIEPIDLAPNISFRARTPSRSARNSGSRTATSRTTLTSGTPLW